MHRTRNDGSHYCKGNAVRNGWDDTGGKGVSWVNHRWNRDTAGAGGCWILACTGIYTYRDGSGNRRWKFGVQVGLMFPGPYVSTTSGTPGSYPTGSWSVGFGLCTGRSSYSSGWNFSLGPGHCSGITSGP